MKVLIIILGLLLVVAIFALIVQTNRFNLQKRITQMYDQRVKDLEVEKEKLKGQLSQKNSPPESEVGYQGH